MKWMKRWLHFPTILIPTTFLVTTRFAQVQKTLSHLLLEDPISPTAKMYTFMTSHRRGVIISYILSSYVTSKTRTTFSMKALSEYLYSFVNFFNGDSFGM